MHFHYLLHSPTKMISLTKGVDFTVNMGGGNDVATVYQDEGIIYGGLGEDKVNFASINEVQQE